MADSPTQGQGAETIPLPKWRARARTEPAPPSDRIEGTAAPYPSPTSPTPPMAAPRFRAGPASRAVAGLLAPALGLAWLIIVVAYVQYALGWEALFFLLPHELVGFVVGSMAPLVLVWLVTAHRRRNAALGRAIDALQDQIAALIYPAEEAAARVEQVSALLRQQSEMLTGASDHALARARQVEESLRQQSHDLGEAAEQAAVQAQRVREALHQQGARLAEMSERARGQSSDLLAVLSRQTDQLDQALTRVAERARQTGAEISSQGELLAAMAAQATQLDDALRELGRGLEASAEQAAARVGEIDKAIERQSKQLRGAAAVVTASSEDMGRSLRQRLDELLTASERALGKIHEVGDAYREQEQVLSDAADRAARRIARLAEVTASESVVLPKAIPAQFQRPPKRPDAAAEAEPARPKKRVFGRPAPDTTEPSHPEIEAPVEVEARRDAFLRSATFVVDNLNSISVDLNRLLERDIPGGVWRLFYRGDKSAFTRRVLTTRSLGDQKRIRRRFRQDPEFREHATHYLTEFEKLLEQAGKWDYENLLRTTFLTADIGKLYLLLSRAVGRESRE